MEFKLDKKLGYKYCYNPTHKLANNSGKVYEHIYVMVQHIGRKLEPNECVHHIDRDRANNSIENLLLLTNEEHGLLHWLEKEFIPEGSIKTKQDLNANKHLLYEDKECLTCSAVFKVLKNSDRKYFSHICATHNRKQFKVSYENLKELVWKFPTTEIAKMFGVSDVAIAKRCKIMGIAKPPRGYWAKKYANKPL